MRDANKEVIGSVLFGCPVNQNNKMAYVYELPEQPPGDFCFGGGISVTFKMVDWFDGWPPDFTEPDGLSKSTWPKVADRIVDFVKRKTYIQKGRRYLIVTDFNTAIVLDTNTEELP